MRPPLSSSRAWLVLSLAAIACVFFLADVHGQFRPPSPPGGGAIGNPGPRPPIGPGGGAIGNPAFPGGANVGNPGGAVGNPGFPGGTNIGNPGPRPPFGPPGGAVGNPGGANV